MSLYASREERSEPALWWPIDLDDGFADVTDWIATFLFECEMLAVLRSDQLHSICDQGRVVPAKAIHTLDSGLCVALVSQRVDGRAVDVLWVPAELLLALATENAAFARCLTRAIRREVPDLDEVSGGDGPIVFTLDRRTSRA